MVNSVRTFFVFKQMVMDRSIFELAKKYAFEYMEKVDNMDVFPQEKALAGLEMFDEALNEDPCSGQELLSMIHKYGSPATTAQTGGRYFGFVNGGAVPEALAAKWLSDVWDQNGGLFYTSAINAKFEEICESWLKDIFELPKETKAGFVSGTSTANLCAIAAARYRLLKNQGWDVNKDGLYGAPKVRIVAHEQVHSSIKKTFAVLGLGKANVEWVPSDDQGRMQIDKMPELDKNTLLILQAGNANTGSFDDFEAVCEVANNAGAWVHIDGAFGLWAQASKRLKYLTKGIDKATSWAVDGHKTLNAPYDSGIVLCRDSDALISAMQATGEYIVYSEKRDPMLFSTEMSKRARAIELWATMKALGKSGIDEMVTRFHLLAIMLKEELEKVGFQIINDVVFNQVLVYYKNDEKTEELLSKLQTSGEVWMGGSTWEGKSVIRVSICSLKTTKEDIRRTVNAFLSFKDV